jgi:hypothetical protein
MVFSRLGESPLWFHTSVYFVAAGHWTTKKDMMSPVSEDDIVVCKKKRVNVLTSPDTPVHICKLCILIASY